MFTDLFSLRIVYLKDSSYTDSFLTFFNVNLPFPFEYSITQEFPFKFHSTFLSSTNKFMFSL